MTDRRRLLRVRNPEPEEFLPGDFVRRIGLAGTGVVESVNGDHATVAWDKDRRDILPFACLTRVEPRGSSLDRRQV